MQRIPNPTLHVAVEKADAVAAATNRGQERLSPKSFEEPSLAMWMPVTPGMRSLLMRLILSAVPNPTN
jgi:hypothetical protein